MNPDPPTARRILLSALGALTVGLGAMSLIAASASRTSACSRGSPCSGPAR